MAVNLSGLNPPGELSISGNVAEQWEKWKQRFDLYISAVGIDLKKDEGRLVSLLLTCLGESGIEIYNSFKFKEEDDKKKYSEVIEKFDEHFLPRKNLTFVRHQFFIRSQMPGESIDQFVTDLKNKSKHCEFKELEDGLVTDRIICGLLNSQLKERLLREHDLTLSRAIEICHASELSSQQLNALENSSSRGVHVVKKMSYSSQKAATSSQHQGGKFIPKTQFQGRPTSSTTKSMDIYSYKKPCSRCGTKHEFKKCPAQGVTCHNCKKLNHFAKVCKGKKQVNLVQYEYEHTVNIEPKGPKYDLYVGNVTSEDNEHDTCKDWRVSLQVLKKMVSFKLDTGSDVNLISKSLLLELGLNESVLKPVKARITTISGETVKALGKCFINCQYRDRLCKLLFYVTDFNCEYLLGRDTCVKLNLVKRVYSLNGVSTKGNSCSKQSTGTNRLRLPVELSEFSDLFDGEVGCVPQKFKITMKENAQPVVSAPRKIPFSLHDKVKFELDKLQSMNIIDKVVKPTDWVSPIVIVVKKNGDLRICLDPKALNDNMCRSHYQLPTVDTVASKLTNAKYFTVLDANAGFWMVPLEEESSYLCTFSTPFGRFKFNRLPFGIRCAPEAFHQIVTQTFEDLPGVDSYIDDIIVYGTSKEEHDRRLRNVLLRARENGFKFNPSKCHFGVNEIKYLGHVFCTEGVKIDDSKVEAIKNMPSPTCKKDLERFLGMTNYVSKFIECYSDKTANLRQLLKNENVWSWDENYEKEFQALKSVLCKSPVLAYFDNAKPVTLSVDASSVGLGASILQEGRPIAYASKALTETQQNYATIEKEMLAITFGCEKFHTYLYNRKVMVETDHRPLESIFKKPLHKVPMRLQRMLLRVQSYDLVVRYKQGKLMYVADTLSRSTVANPNDDFDDEIELHVNMLVNNLPVSDAQLSRFKMETERDSVLSKVKLYDKNGWPISRADVDDYCKSFWNYRDEISVNKGLVFKNDKIVVPASMQSDMLKIIHEGHFGIDKCKMRAREVMFWPGMCSQITDLVNNCFTCKQFQNANCKEPMLSHAVPNLPWEHVGSDLFEYKNANYVLVVDYYSNYIEVCKLPDTKAVTVIAYLKSIFSRHGIPKILTNNNGPQYTSQEFENFLKEWGIKGNRTSPYHPRSNGLAEKSVGTVKQMLRKCDQSGEDPYLAMLNLRNTPRNGIPSPAEMLMSRKLNCRLPMSTKMLKPKCVRLEVQQKLVQGKEKSKHYYDKHSKPLSNLNHGQNVMFKRNPKDKAWTYGKLKSKDKEPRSYIVEDQDQNCYRRNRIHIVPFDQNKSPVVSKSPCTKSNVNSPVNPELLLNPNVNSPNENQTIAKMNDYTTRAGRTIRNPKRFTFSNEEVNDE